MCRRKLPFSEAKYTNRYKNLRWYLNLYKNAVINEIFLLRITIQTKTTHDNEQNKNAMDIFLLTNKVPDFLFPVCIKLFNH